MKWKKNSNGNTDELVGLCLCTCKKQAARSSVSGACIKWTEWEVNNRGGWCCWEELSLLFVLRFTERTAGSLFREIFFLRKEAVKLWLSDQVHLPLLPLNTGQCAVRSP